MRRYWQLLARRRTEAICACRGTVNVIATEKLHDVIEQKLGVPRYVPAASEAIRLWKAFRRWPQVAALDVVNAALGNRSEPRLAYNAHMQSGLHIDRWRGFWQFTCGRWFGSGQSRGGTEPVLVNQLQQISVTESFSRRQPHSMVTLPARKAAPTSVANCSAVDLHDMPHAGPILDTRTDKWLHLMRFNWFHCGLDLETSGSESWVWRRTWWGKHSSRLHAI